MTMQQGNPDGLGHCHVSIGGAANPGRPRDTVRAFALAGIIDCEARGL